MDRIICDASPLIVLAKSDLLELLPGQFSEVIVPQAVVDEILAGPLDDPMRRFISEIEWLKHVQIDPPLSPLGSWQLGRGESEVIEYARLQRDCAVLMDDRAARRTAIAIGINVYGTLSIIAKAVHQVSPYICKMKSSMAKELISTFTHEGEILYDPYCGCGTVALEAWAAGRNIIANDLSPYAVVLTQAKLFPYFALQDAFCEIANVAKEVRKIIQKIDLRKVPKWVRDFFHTETLREIIAWFQVLRSRKSYFLISCFLGILHHQRPGFLSYPSSHAVLYLRQKCFCWRENC